MMSPCLLEIDSLSLGYNERQVLSGFSLAVGPGEFLGLVGANGSGKSTLIRAVSRVLKPLSGTIKIEGEDIWQHSAPWLAKKLAVVPQDSPVAFDFTILEAVLMGRSPHLGRFAVEGKHDVAVAWECLKLTKMEHLAERPVSAVSGGERQRASIARALAQEPKILLADEPIAHLDISHQIQVLDLLQHLAKEKNVAVIAALHDLNLASSYCDRLVMLAGGRAIACGAPAQVITEENLRHAFGVYAQVKAHPASGRPYITLAHRHSFASPFSSKSLAKALKIHVICGAGTGAELIRELSAQGYEVSVGVVNVSDSDQQAAEALDLERVEEAPFSAVSEESFRQNSELAKAADVVVVCALPFGEGNLANLEAAKEALCAGKKVVLINTPKIEERDFKGGKAVELFEKMIAEGAVAEDDVGSVYQQIVE